MILFDRVVLGRDVRGSRDESQQPEVKMVDR